MSGGVGQALQMVRTLQLLGRAAGREEACSFQHDALRTREGWRVKGCFALWTSTLQPAHQRKLWFIGQEHQLKRPKGVALNRKTPHQPA